MKKLPIGISDFKEIIEDDYYYIDKSLFIKEVIDSSKILIVMRPRRFGKSINLSLLKHFYEKTTEDTSYIFQNLAIWKEDKKYTEKQGKYPVISLSLKSLKEDSWESMFKGIKELIIEEFNKHDYLLEWTELKKSQRRFYNSILDNTGERIDYIFSLKKLAQYLTKYHQTRTVILLDEYDSIITHAYLKGFYQQVITFMRNFMEATFKDNPDLEKAVIIGILRVAKEGLFSGLNNADEYGIVNSGFSDKFGFTQKEVSQTLSKFGIQKHIKQVQQWYNGYSFTKTKAVYNPWSIINYVKNYQDQCKPYWVNTSNNELIKKVLFANKVSVKKQIEQLVEGKPISSVINEYLIFDDLEKHPKAIWTLLLASGYLTVLSKKRDEFGLLFVYDLAIPNKEVKTLYWYFIKEWLEEQIANEELTLMLKALIQGNIKLFEQKLRYFAEVVFSYHDTQGKRPESFYHAFILGLLVNLEHQYEINSNREAGYGRYDIVLIPKKEEQKRSIIIEIKSPEKYDDISLEQALQEAIEQIQKKKYEATLKQRGFKNVLKIAIAVKGKNLKMKAI